jgi:hypothetical protein
VGGFAKVTDRDLKLKDLVVEHVSTFTGLKPRALMIATDRSERVSLGRHLCWMALGHLGVPGEVTAQMWNCSSTVVSDMFRRSQLFPEKYAEKEKRFQHLIQTMPLLLRIELVSSLEEALDYFVLGLPLHMRKEVRSFIEGEVTYIRCPPWESLLRVNGLRYLISQPHSLEDLRAIFVYFKKPEALRMLDHRVELMTRKGA